MKDYDPKDIEPKWQAEWEKQKLNEAQDDSSKPKWYSLIEFPYPSGEGLHVGHPRPYIGMDIISRKRRMEGYNVLYPIGFDAFGLPAENYAIKTKRNPADITEENIATFRKQIDSLAISFDWSRQVNTTDPKYYKWTQWIFLKFLEHGLAYKSKQLINWCPKDKIGLANEEVVNGKCERCGTVVEKREKEQWMLAITKYADRLDKDLDTVDYSARIKTQQRNWIGRSEGAEIDFLLNFKDSKLNENRGPNGERAALKIFTTRPDTIFGATYLVISPEHLWVTLATDENHDVLENKEEVKTYVEGAKKKTDIDRTSEGKDKTGVELKGVKAINPATKEEIPIWVADYVLPHYGTGAIMAVPAHDERDFAFATKFKLPIKEVVIPKIIDKHDPPMEGKKTVERRSIQAIIIDPKTAKVLMLRWKKFPWTTFITGGVENDEDLVEASKREILEETGYKNVRYIRTLGGLIESHYFANHKDENRKAIFSGLLFELENNDRIEPTEDEKAIHEAHWMTWDEIATDKNTKCAEYDILLDRLNNPEHAFSDLGVIINSGEYSGLDSEQGKKKITEAVGGKWLTKFKLRDWIFSRQRYWGEPIPVIHCEKCGIVPVPEKDLPVLLPKVEHYEPTDTGESPLAAVAEWVNTTCPKCDGPAKRETDTMPNWAGSSWYFLRYSDPHNDKVFASEEALKHWMPVDWYNGGMEHTTLHLLYSRFWNKFLFDLGLVPTSEPYKKRTSHGFILAENGEKMSKSRGNVVNPNAIVEQFGADTLRVFEMFIGPFDQAIAWSEAALVGPRRFIEKVWKLREKVSDNAQLTSDDEYQLHTTIKKVSLDIEDMGFNTAVSSLMIYTNYLEKMESISKGEYETLLQLLAPFAPHVTEELWIVSGHSESVHLSTWPVAKVEKLAKKETTIIVQVNGKVRASLSLESIVDDQTIQNMALQKPEIAKWLDGKEVVRFITVPGKVVNIVTT